MPGLVLPGVGDEEPVIDILDVERSKPVRKVCVLEGTGARDRLEVLVKYIDRATAEIRGIQEAAAGGIRGQGESFIDSPGR